MEVEGRRRERPSPRRQRSPVVEVLDQTQRHVRRVDARRVAERGDTSLHVVGVRPSVGSGAGRVGRFHQVAGEQVDQLGHRRGHEGIAPGQPPSVDVGDRLGRGRGWVGSDLGGAQIGGPVSVHPGRRRKDRRPMGGAGRGRDDRGRVRGAIAVERHRERQTHFLDVGGPVPPRPKVGERRRPVARQAWSDEDGHLEEGAVRCAPVPGRQRRPHDVLGCVRTHQFSTVPCAKASQ